MKKYIFLILALFPLSVGAVSFGGNPNLTAPQFINNSGAVGSFQLFDSGSWNRADSNNYTYYRTYAHWVDSDVTLNANSTSIIQFNKGYFGGADFSLPMVFHGLNQGNETDMNASVGLFAEKTSTGYNFYVDAFGVGGTFISTTKILHLPLDFTCGTTNPNTCAFVFSTNFLISYVPGFNATYLNSVQLVVYNAGANNTALFTNYNFSSGSSYIGTWQQLKYYVAYLGSSVFGFSGNGIQLASVALNTGEAQLANPYQLIEGNPFSSLYLYNRDNAIYDENLNDWLGGFTGSVQSPTAKQFFDFDGFSLYVASGSVSGNPYDTGSSVPYYANCVSFSDFGCYLKGFGDFFVDNIKNGITGLFNYFLPDISFSGQFNSCGTFSSGSTVSISQRFANIVAIINFIPPEEGTEICTIYGPQVIHYGVLWPEENFFQKYIPGQVPALEIDPHIAFGQTIVDIITIFAFILLIFYKKHD